MTMHRSNLTLKLVLLAFLFTFSLSKREKKLVYNSEEEGNSKVKFPPEWHLWKSQHGKVYQDEREELQRHIVWLANKKHIEEHNKFADEFGYTLKMNQFGDLVCEFHIMHACKVHVFRLWFFVLAAC